MIQGNSERYQVFGLQIESELLLSELVTNNAKPDVYVRFGKISEIIDRHSLSGICYKSDIQKFLLRVDGVAQYLIENGNSITIDRSEGGSDEEIRLFLLGSAFGALIHQRGMFPLHGSAVVVNNQALVFSGISGAGKSTLAAGFVKRGYKLLADDVCVVTLDIDGRPIVHPAYPQMKLWADSVLNLGHKSMVIKNISKKISKISLPFTAEFFNTPLTLRGVYIISKGEGHVEVMELHGTQRINAIKGNTYRQNFMMGDDNTESQNKHLVAISNHCFIKNLIRPPKGFHISKLIEVVENDIDVKYTI
jgi:hypothetical protein